MLNEAKKRQVIALERLGWSLRRIQKSTGVRQETAATYLREVGIGLRPRKVRNNGDEMARASYRVVAGVNGAVN